MDNSKSDILKRMHELYSEEKPIASLTESVFIRPRMYTINGTLEEVGAFLEGFYSGMCSHNRNPQAQAEAQTWFDFCEWSVEHIDATMSGGWHTLFKIIRNECKDDENALFRLLELYLAFKKIKNENT